ncbi:MAG: 50S ribosomal protein L19 [Planctomycetota bacterium]
MIHPLIQAAEKDSLKADDKIPQLEVGAEVDVFYRIIEGKKERVQRFTGTVISIKGRGTTKTFTVRRIVAGEGVERIFPFHSPNVDRVEVKRVGRIRRARLYYLRDRVGKSTRLAEKKSDMPAKKDKKAAKK